MCTMNENHMRYGSCDREWDRIFSHFGPFCPFAPLTIQIITILKKQKKHLEMLSFYLCVPKITIMMYASWNMECNRQYILSFWAIFCPFTPIITWKIKTLKKQNKPGYIIILHLCTTNNIHMMYGSWDMEHDRQNFLSFWAIFSHLPH